MQELAGRKAVVTGGGRGIGRAIAARLSRSGVDVTVMGRTEAHLRETVDAGDASGWAILDVSEEASVEDAFASLGAPDYLISNAGSADSAPFMRTSRGSIQRMLDVNLFGFYHCAKAVLPQMRERGSGRILAIASTAGTKGYPYVTAYCSAKHAVVGMVRALALETARTGITVNAVCPGYTDTELVRSGIDRIVAKSGQSHESVLSEFIKHNPQGRLVRPEEVAASVQYLCSDDAASVTGETLMVAGGET